jgi:hypothetical protein
MTDEATMSGAHPGMTSTKGAELRIAHRGAGLLLGSFGPVFVAVWSSKPTPELFELQRAGLAAAVQANPGRELFLCVVSPSADPPEQAERDASAKMITGHGDQLAGCACVIEGNGFRAAITRTVLTGIAFLIRTRAPVTFFESVELSVAWLQRRAGSSDLGQLARQVERARFS